MGFDDALMVLIRGLLARHYSQRRSFFDGFPTFGNIEFAVDVSELFSWSEISLFCMPSDKGSTTSDQSRLPHGANTFS